MSVKKCPRLSTELQLEILEVLAEDARHAVSEFQYDKAWRCYAQLLLPAILVNRDWATRGTDLLWREPFTPALAEIHPQRRQLYADKVQSIGLYLYRADHLDSPAAFANLSFPQLKRLEINSCPPCMSLDLRPYLSSSITSFTMLKCSHLPKSLLDLVAFCCPELRDVNLDYGAGDQRNEHFLKFLRKCKRLRELTLSSENGLRFPVDVLENLASRKQLECFCAPLNLISYRSVAAIMQDNPRLRPFRNANNLFLSIESRAVRPVLSAAESLVELQLNLADSEIDVFGLIGTLHCLETVELSFSKPKRLAMHELQSISGLTRLKELSICGPPAEPHRETGPLLVAEAWTDILFDTWISSYSHLEKLLFGVCPMDSHWISETRIVGKSCLKLTTLSMAGIHDIGVWRVSSPPLFPELRYLELGQLKPWPFSTSAEETDEYAKGLARMIYQHAPMLEKFSVGQNDLADAVVEAYEEEKGLDGSAGNVNMYDARSQ
ncbi:unnamed protein product [Aureobasidium uvarum]|uniref:F-box domain-containing protein n=1 Tax=Aureobasidium uvarum TaxID=2773716 RepID=A0A9N8KDZ2_9PEZI|nr:unnamed protein product [Aureobasidium uvarum]